MKKKTPNTSNTSIPSLSTKKSKSLSSDFLVERLKTINHKLKEENTRLRAKIALINDLGNMEKVIDVKKELIAKYPDDNFLKFSLTEMTNRRDELRKILIQQ